MNKQNTIAPRLFRVLGEYSSQISAFSPNARFYLLNVILTGAVMGVFRLIFNFYVLSLGFDEALLGNLITTSSFVALIVALPMGYLADIIGRKGSLVLSGALLSISILTMALWQSETSFYSMNVLSGIAQSLAGVTMSPFLMENSNEKERTYLFSFGQGLQMTMASVGNWVGGYLPTWMGNAKNVIATSSTAYGDSILIIGIGAALAIIPLVFLTSPKLTHSQRAIFAPFQYAAKNPLLLTKLILPMLLTSLGAGLVMPFMNVFFREVHHQPDPVIGTLFAWGSLAMGIGLPDLHHGTRGTIRPRHRCQPHQHGMEFWLGIQPHHQRLAASEIRVRPPVHRNHHSLHHLCHYVLGIFLARQHRRRSSHRSGRLNKS